VSFDLFSTLVDLDDVEDDAVFHRFAVEMRADGIDASAEWWRERKDALTEAAFDHAPRTRPCGGDIDVYGVFLSMVVEATAGRLSDSHAAARLAARRFRRCATRSLQTVPEVVAALPALRDEFSLLLISNTQRCYSEDEIDEFGLRTWFDAVVFSSDVGVCKPYPELFDSALAAAGARPEQWLHVGDNPHDDARGAMSLGGAAIFLHRPDRAPIETATIAAIEHDVEAVVTVRARTKGHLATDQLVVAIREWSLR
jgi:putative hydrolase of the HAD superfamily